MLPLASEPTEADFTDVKDYKSSNPKTFALNETPVLFLVTEATCSGALSGPGKIWISSSGLSIWLREGRGALIPQSSIVLHAKQSSRVYVQGADFELWLDASNSGTYDAILECLEVQQFSDEDLEGDSIDDRFLDLESGQGDDDSWGAPRSRSLSSAQVLFQNSLGKRTRE